MMTPEVERLVERHKRIYKRKGQFSPALERIIDEVAIELQVTRQVVIDVVAAQFMMVRDIISLPDKEERTNFEDLKTIRLVYFGTFMPSIKKFNKYNEK